MYAVAAARGLLCMTTETLPAGAYRHGVFRAPDRMNADRHGGSPSARGGAPMSHRQSPNLTASLSDGWQYCPLRGISGPALRRSQSGDRALYPLLRSRTAS
jgi:hypothetical protein